MGTHNGLMAVLFVSILAIAAETANAEKPADRGDADAGRDLAVQACAGCHVVSADQPFPPLLRGAPDFREIADRPNVTAASLRRTIAALPLVPRKGGMANPDLTGDELADVAALYHDPAGTSRKSVGSEGARHRGMTHQNRSGPPTSFRPALRRWRNRLAVLIFAPKASGSLTDGAGGFRRACRWAWDAWCMASQRGPRRPPKLYASSASQACRSSRSANFS
jgi:mono/diheme cytochrome c family protein